LEKNQYTNSGGNNTHANPIMLLAEASEKELVQIIYVSNSKHISGSNEHYRPLTLQLSGHGNGKKVMAKK
jgi:hypothetical protein